MAAPPSNPDHKPNRAQDKSSSASGGGRNALVEAEKLLQIALILPCALVVGWGAGVLMDRWLHQHWIYIVGLILGAIAGLVEAVRQAMRAGMSPHDGKR
jgi:ATP synthase protein I